MTRRLFQLSFFTLFVLTLASCNSRNERISPADSTITPARTARVEHRQRIVEIAGTVRATDVAHLASRFGGFISSLPARAGMNVKKGTLLVVLDDRNLAAQREKVLAARMEAQKTSEAAEAQKRLADSTFKRIEALHQKHSASFQEFDEARSRKEAAEASYQASMERIRQTDSDFKDIRASADYLRIVAPFDGTITEVSADSGTFVNPGQPILALEARAAYQVLFSVEEDLIGNIKPGQKIAVSIPVLSNEEWMATVEEINSATDAETRTFLIKANLPVDAALRGGLSARVFLPLDSSEGLWIPEEFLQRQHDIESVLVKEGNTWQRILVRSGKHQEGRVEI